MASPPGQPNVIMGIWGALLFGVVFGGGAIFLGSSFPLFVAVTAAAVVVGFSLGRRF